MPPRPQLGGVRRAAAATVLLLVLAAGCLGTNDGTAGAGGEGALRDESGAPSPGVEGAVTGFPDSTENYTLYVDGEEYGEVTLEVANTAGERSRGLMGREELPRDRGMVFVYPDEETRSFWMKDTLIPLDMVFLDAEMRVLNVEHAEPQPDAPDSELEWYHSDGGARYVLEFNAGFADRAGIEAGDRLRFREAG